MLFHLIHSLKEKRSFLFPLPWLLQEFHNLYLKGRVSSRGRFWKLEFKPQGNLGLDILSVLSSFNPANVIALPAQYVG